MKETINDKVLNKYKLFFFGFTKKIGYNDSEKDNRETLTNVDSSDSKESLIIIETSENNNKFELLKQLHDQFAENDNNKVTSVISFIAAIFAVFIGYGYCLYNYCLYDYKKQLLKPLLFSITASDAVLTLLAILCLYFGYSTRRDNCVIYNIRNMYNVKLPYKVPFERNLLNFLPDYYTIMYSSCIVFILGISLSSLFVIENRKLVLGFAFAALLFIVVFYFFYYHKFNKFKEKCENDKN